MFSFNLFPDFSNGTFKTQYKCYSVSMLPGNERKDVERGGKIMMPPSALNQLTRLNIEYPMLFKLTNPKTNRVTHCGVLEFVADEGKIYIPYWMMRNILLEEGGLAQVESVSLPVATFSKFQPQTIDFLDITNHKALLENALRNFACLTTGDIIAIEYNDQVYEMCVLETKPGKAVSIIECDMNVEFAAPVGYKEDNRMEEDKAVSETPDDDAAKALEYVDKSQFVAFTGQGNRVDGKNHKIDPMSKPLIHPHHIVRGIPDYDFDIHQLTFFRGTFKKADDLLPNPDGPSAFQPFSTEGQHLRSKKPR